MFAWDRRYFFTKQRLNHGPWWSTSVTVLDCGSTSVGTNKLEWGWEKTVLSTPAYALRIPTFDVQHLAVLISMSLFSTFSIWKKLDFFLRFVAFDVFLSVVFLSMKVWKAVIEVKRSELVTSVTLLTEKKMTRKTNCGFLFLYVRWNAHLHWIYENLDSHSECGFDCRKITLLVVKRTSFR